MREKWNKVTLLGAMFAAVTFTACHDNESESDPDYVSDWEELIPVPTVDELSETTGLSAAIISTDKSPVVEMSEFVNYLEVRLTNRSASLTDQSKVVVIYGHHLDTLSTNVATLKAAYERGVMFVVIAPKDEHLDAFLEAIGHKRAAITKEHDKEDSHFCDAYAFNNKSKTFVLHDIFDDDMLYSANGKMAESTLSQEGASVTSDTSNFDPKEEMVEQSNPVSAYHYGKLADELVKWIKKAEINSFTPVSAPLAALRQLKAGELAANENDVATLAAQQVVTFNYSIPLTERMTGWINKGADRRAYYIVNYYIYSLYSFNQNLDYYLIHQEIVGTHDGVVMGRWSAGDWYWYACNLSNLCLNATFLSPSGDDIRNQTNLTNIYPPTSEGSTTYTTSQGFSLGGSVGFNGMGGTGSVTGGVSWNESWSTNILDVTISNYSNSGGTKAVEWSYKVKDPRIHSDYWNTTNHRMAIDDAPLVGRATMTVNNTWIWTINPASFTGKFQVKSNIQPLFLMSKAKQNWLGTQEWSQAEDGYVYENSLST